MILQPAVRKLWTISLKFNHSKLYGGFDMREIRDEHKVIDYSYPLLIGSDAKVIHEITVTSKISRSRADTLIAMFDHLLDKYKR